MLQTCGLRRAESKARPQPEDRSASFDCGLRPPLTRSVLRCRIKEHYDDAHIRRPDQPLRRPAHLYLRRPQAFLRPRGGGGQPAGARRSERPPLFYAESGAGKSSLINACRIPQLREEEGFSVLPVGRVAGQLPSDVAQADNIFLFNLMSSLDTGGGSPAQWAHLGLSEFLEHLVNYDGLVWRYHPPGAPDLPLWRKLRFRLRTQGRPRALPWSSTSSRR